MMSKEYMNMFTGEVNDTWFEAFKAALFDIRYFPKCRNIKIFHIIRIK